ncbi:MAG: DUF4296 domain-containing protein [Bacteroidetes bacterium]|nr:DUF4296 domain-containing protein [Bacteroidota bacterium]MBS1630621.1 DUF4296 domain-containing protein [Bacteroidota bacterium]
MKNGIVFCLIILFLSATSCTQKQAHLPPEKMAPIMAELQLADVYSGMLHKPGQPNRGKDMDSLAAWTKAILDRHQVSREEFSSSLDWYRDRPVQLDSLYTGHVLPILEEWRKH